MGSLAPGSSPVENKDKFDQNQIINSQVEKESSERPRYNVLDRSYRVYGGKEQTPPICPGQMTTDFLSFPCWENVRGFRKYI